MSAPLAPRLSAPQALTAALCAIFSFLLLSWCAYFGKAQDINPLKPAYIHFAVIICGLAALTLPRKPEIRLPTAFFVFLTSFAVLLLVEYAYLSLGDREVDIWRNHLAFCLTTGFLVVLFSRLTTLRPVILATQFVIAISAMIIAVEYFRPGLLPFRLSQIPGRAAGLHENPNAAALILAILLPIATLNTRPITRILLCAATGFAVLLTFSRGGLIVAALSIVSSLYIRPKQAVALGYRELLLGFLTAGFALIIYFFHDGLLHILAQALRPFLTTDTLGRLELASSASSFERVRLARQAFDLASSGSLLGQGVGFTRAGAWGQAVGPHNMFLLMYVEHGLLGVLLFMLFLFALLRFRSPFGLWIGTLFLVSSVFLHNFFDLPGYGVLFVLYWAAGELEAEMDPALAKVDERPIRVAGVAERI